MLFQEGNSLIKVRKKWLSILLTLAMLTTLLLPFGGVANAATNNYALTTPNVTLGNARTLGTVRVLETTPGSIAVGTEIMVTLPSGCDYAAAPAVGTLANYVNLPANVGDTSNKLTGGVGTDVVFVSGTTRTLVVRVAAIGTAANDACIIEFLFNGAATSQVNLTSGSGDLKVNIFETTGAVTSGDVVNARIVTGGTSASALSAPSRTEGNNRAIGTIRIVENSAGALAVGANSISLVLPDGYTWTAAPGITLAGGFGAGAVTANAPDTDAQGRSRVRLNVVAQSAVTPGVIDIAGAVDIASTAADGDCNLSLSGTNTGITAATLTVAKKVGFGVTVSAKSTPDIYAGRFDATPGITVLKESAAGSLVLNRTITFELPQGVAWRTVPTVNVVSGNVVIGAGVIVANTNNRKVSYTVTTASTTTSEIEFRSGTIDIEVDTAAGDLVCTVGGTATASGTANIAKIVTPVTASATKPDVIIGQQDQAAGDVTITEAGAGVILAQPRGFAGNLVIMTPAGVSFAAKPTVEVTAGNLKLNTQNMTLNSPNNNTLTIPVQTSSTEASTIKLSNIKLTVDRTVPQGAVTLSIGGSALDMVNLGVPFEAAAKADNANCGTPAPTETKGVAVFKIGDAKYTVNGVEQTMDAAAYIESDRTFVPLRYVAYAAGVSAENILYANGKVTIIKGDKVVQLTIGSNAMVINGITITMDVNAVVKSGRTMLPVRWVSQALGCTVNYDATAQTVTVQ